ncbi:uncharacterized protein LOC131174028 [Hevea brasiliensis]|uniref:uncharacterized protein LOC131174028 n=1 Tax=Hevea brasiliensis TaxID=3981 RepID=UPI0025FDC9CE|nr:uncharacterized protein LOC131174028 [Hevea brasiliensis]
MTKQEYTLAGLLNILVIARGNIPGRKGNEVALVASSSSGKTKKKKKNNKKKPSSALGPSNRVGKKSQTVKKKAEAAPTDKGKCFHCQKEGHWKRNYPEYLELVKNKKARPSKGISKS